MEGLFIAITQLDPSTKLENETSPAIANKQIHDADAPGHILQESAGQLLKLTTLDNPIDIAATIHIPTNIEDMASCDNEVAFIILQELKGVYGFTGVDKFLQKILRLVMQDMPCKLHLKCNPKLLGMGRLIFIVATIGTKISILQCLLSIQLMATTLGILVVLS